MDFYIALFILLAAGAVLFHERRREITWRKNHRDPNPRRYN